MSAPMTHDPLVVNTKDGAVWLRRAVTQDGRGLYAVDGSCRCPEYLMATLVELAEHGIAGSADVLPVPVGPEPLEDRERVELLTAFKRALAPFCGDPMAAAAAVAAARDAEVEWLLADAQRLQDRVTELEHTVQQMCDALNGHDCPPPGETPFQLVTRVSIAWSEAEARVAELEAAPTFVYRAEHPDSGIVLGVYSTRDAAADHCEALATREGATGLVSWVPDDGDALSPEELTYFDVEYCDGDDVPVQTCTGYVVTPLEVASEYDEEADE